MPTRTVPAADAILYDAGAEGYAIENGFDHYDIPSKQIEQDAVTLFGQRLKPWAYQTSFRLNDGYWEPAVECFKEIDVIAPRMRMVQKDTLLSRYNRFGGKFEEALPLEPPRFKRLHQVSVAKNTIVRAESVYFPPQNAPIAFTIQRLPSKHDNDETTYPAKVQVVICDTWAIRFSNGQDAGIYRYTAGQWRQEKHLDLSAKDREIVVWMVVRAGCVCFSFDQGRKWEIARDDAPLNVPTGQVVIESVSCSYAFGFHQLAADTCYYDTVEIPALENHIGTPYYDLSQTYQPASTAVSVSFLPSPPGTFKYRVTMKVNSFINVSLGWNFYVVPEVYGVLVGWNAVLAPPVGSSVNLVSVGVTTGIEISEERDITQRTGTINLLWDSQTPFTGSYGWRLLDINLGWGLDNGTWDIQDRCLMYIIQPEPTANSDFQTDIVFQLVDTYIRAVKTKVDEGWAPLDGLTCVQARNYVLLKCGLPPTRASWLNTGRSLPSGLPNKPKWWPKIGMTAAEVYEAIDIFEGTETFVAADGTWTSRPYRFTNASVDFTFDGDATDPTLRIEEFKNRSEHREVVTAIKVEGEDLRSAPFWMTYFDYNLERNTAYGGFVGFRIWDFIDNIKITSLADALLVLAQVRAAKQAIPILPEVRVPGRPDIYRGYRIKLNSSEMVGGIDANEYRVEALVHRWRPGKRNTKTEIKARKIV